MADNKYIWTTFREGKVVSSVEWKKDTKAWVKIVLKNMNSGSKFDGWK